MSVDFLPPRPLRQDDPARFAQDVAGGRATENLRHIARLLNPGAPEPLGGMRESAAGAPDIDPPLFECAAEDMIAFIGAIMSKIQDGQLRTAREGIDMSQRKMEERHKAAMDKINEWIKNTEEASRNDGAGGFFGWMSRIGGPAAPFIGVIVAVTATVLTMGAATPLLVAFLAVSIVASSLALASSVAKEAGYDKPLDVSYWMAKGFSTMLTDKFGVSKEDAEHGGKLLSGVVGTLSIALLLTDPKFVGQLAGGAAGLAGEDATNIAIIEGVVTVVATIAIMLAAGSAGAGKAAKAGEAAEAAAKISRIEKGAHALNQVGRATQGGLAVSNGTAGIGSGAIDAMKAGDQRDAAMAQADKEGIQATITRIQRLMEEERQALRKVMDEMVNVISVVCGVLENAARARSQIASSTPHQFS